MSANDFLGLLGLFLVGWGVAWLALRNMRFALLPAFSTLFFIFVSRADPFQAWLGKTSEPDVFVVPIFFLAFALWGVIRFPLSIVWRVVLVSVIVPLLVMSLAYGVLLWMLKQFP